MTEVGFDDIRPVLREFPAKDGDAESRASSRLSVVQSGGGDRAVRALTWMSAWQGRYPPTAERPRLCLFAGVHGVAADEEATDRLGRRIAAIGAGEAPVHDLCAALDADLRVYEMALDRPSADFRRGPALDEEACARATAYGMMAVDEGIDLLGLGTLSLGAEEAAAALLAGLAEDDDADALETLRRFGGEDIAGVLGALIAARMARVPAVLEGAGALAAGAVLNRLVAGGADHARSAAPTGVDPDAERDFGPILDESQADEGADAARAMQWLRDTIAETNA